MKKMISIICIVMVCVLSLCGCGKKGLSGTYENKEGTYGVEFREDGTCTWMDHGEYYEGTYVKDGDYWKLYFDGYMDIPEEVMDVQVYVMEDGVLESFSPEFMERLLIVE